MQADGRLPRLDLEWPAEQRLLLQKRDCAAAAGREALLHGAAFDIRWKAPVYADLTITPNARVVKAEADCLIFEIDAVISGGATAMVGTVTIPLPREAA